MIEQLTLVESRYFEVLTIASRDVALILSATRVTESHVLQGPVTLQWRHNEQPSVSNHRRLDCLFIRSFRLTSKKTSKPVLLALCEGNPPMTGGFPSQGPVTRKPFPFDDAIIMKLSIFSDYCSVVDFTLMPRLHFP